MAKWICIKFKVFSNLTAETHTYHIIQTGVDMPSYLNVEFTSHENASASIVIMDKGLNSNAGHADDVAHVKEVAEHASFNGKKGQSYLHVHHDAGKAKAILAIGSGDGVSNA